MTDIPIIFSGPMVRALLDGRKTMTRRLASRPPTLHDSVHADLLKPSPWQKVKPGYRLWVREAHHFWQPASDASILGPPMAAYEVENVREGPAIPDADIERLEHWLDGRGRPSIHMPRWASRLTLTVTATKIERLQDISEPDALAEGVPHGDVFHPIAECLGEAQGKTFCPKCGGWGVYGGLGQNLGVVENECAECDTAKKLFRNLWLSLHGVESWDANPEVVALTFTVHKVNIDQMAEV